MSLIADIVSKRSESSPKPWVDSQIGHFNNKKRGERGGGAAGLVCRWRPQPGGMRPWGQPGPCGSGSVAAGQRWHPGWSSTKIVTAPWGIAHGCSHCGASLVTMLPPSSPHCGPPALRLTPSTSSYCEICRDKHLISSASPSFPAYFPAFFSDPIIDFAEKNGTKGSIFFWVSSF